MASPAIKLMSVAEYLEMEDASVEKHEYIGGEVLTMAGASFVYNEIVSNTFIDIGSHLREKPCRIYGSDLKVAVKTESAFVYSDITIICGGPQFVEGRKDTVINPAVTMEVLSPATGDYDHGQKFMLYRQIPSFKEYLLISSTQMMLEHFVKESNGS